MKTRRIALTLLMLLVLIVPVYAQAQDSTATVEPTAEVIEATAEATAEATVEAGAAETIPPETTPVAGVAEAPNESEFNGASLLVLLVGLLAIGAVAFGTLVRTSYNNPPSE